MRGGVNADSCRRNWGRLACICYRRGSRSLGKGGGGRRTRLGAPPDPLPPLPPPTRTFRATNSSGGRGGSSGGTCEQRPTAKSGATMARRRRDLPRMRSGRRRPASAYPRQSTPPRRMRAAGGLMGRDPSAARRAVHGGSCVNDKTETHAIIPSAGRPSSSECGQRAPAASATTEHHICMYSFMYRSSWRQEFGASPASACEGPASAVASIAIQSRLQTPAPAAARDYRCRPARASYSQHLRGSGGPPPARCVA